MSRKINSGFTLVELIAVIILVGILSVTLFSRLGPTNTAAVQGSRDDVIAALFFAQQVAMARNSVQVDVSATAINVKENGTAIKVSNNYYPLAMPASVTLSSTRTTYVYNKLGKTTPGQITVTGSAQSGGASATIIIEASGYAYAQ